MPRKSRIIVPGLPHHVTQRGNRKTETFREDQDRTFFLCLLRDYSQQYDVKVDSYCLMDNHFHLISRPPSKLDHCRMMHDLNGHYAGYFNARYEMTGHLWQARYYSCPMDEDHCWNTLRYVIQNPVRARLVDDPSKYRWSSAAYHLGISKDRLVSGAFSPGRLTSEDKEWLRTPLEAEELDRIRSATAKGIPYGSPAFIQGLEQALGVELRSRQRGRKPRRR